MKNLDIFKKIILKYSSSYYVNMKSNLVHDLIIVGDDFSDLIFELEKEFNIELHFLAKYKYCPTEGEWGSLSWFRKSDTKKLLDKCKPLSLEYLFKEIESEMGVDRGRS
ncbi:MULTISPECIES: DUF1493 family protein [unclassified Pseudoalteromonas]|uniref:DUF1493 family protein n=1 Tax=unclassified Pseudoalteromonas TaxID=194690 RepID=UPI0005A83947|nr:MULTISPECIES: DUF1493 family protein [unclassified Pseudoalteromonas]